MPESHIVVTEIGIKILDLEIPVKSVADFLKAVPEEERNLTVVKAVEVGIFCLERGRTAQDTEFVKRQISEMLNAVEQSVVGIPAKTEQALVAKMGTNDGQVLAPVKQLLAQVSSDTTTRINEVKTLLAQDLDPAKSTSVLGKALQMIRDLLDAQRADSVQGTLQKALTSITAADGALARVVKSTVEDGVKPVKEEVDKLAKEIKGTEAAAEALQQTTAKGTSYEEEDVPTLLQPWAKAVGAQVKHVGKDNQPGDYVVTTGWESLGKTPVTIVIEARNQQTKMGNQRISQEMTAKMIERKADVGIYVSKTREGLAKEVGDWSEGVCEKGPWVACTHENLITALRFVIVEHQLKKLSDAAREVDSALIQAQVTAIRTALGRVKTINTKITSITSSANGITDEVDNLRKEINGALNAVEEALKSHPAQKPAASAPELEAIFAAG